MSKRVVIRASGVLLLYAMLVVGHGAMHQTQVFALYAALLLYLWSYVIRFTGVPAVAEVGDKRGALCEMQKEQQQLPTLCEAEQQLQALQAELYTQQDQYETDVLYAESLDETAVQSDVKRQ